MAYYNNYGAFSPGLYGSPNYVMANAQTLENQIQQCGYSNFNGMNGCFPCSTGYTPAPGYAQMPFPMTGNGYYGQTDINYTSNANGTSYSYSQGPSATDYIGVIGMGLASCVGAYYNGQINNRWQEYNMKCAEEDRAFSNQIQSSMFEQQSFQNTQNNLIQMVIMTKLMQQMSGDQKPPTA